MKKVIPVLIGLVALAVLGFVMLSGSETNKNNESTSEPASSQTGQPDNTPIADKTFTAEEVATHNSAQDCWTIIDGSVYDLTSFIGQHPGGSEILRACGQDGTSLFHTRHTEDGEAVGSGSPHSSSAESQLESLKIGELAD